MRPLAKEEILAELLRLGIDSLAERLYYFREYLEYQRKHDRD